MWAGVPGRGSEPSTIAVSADRAETVSALASALVLAFGPAPGPAREVEARPRQRGIRKHERPGNRRGARPEPGLDHSIDQPAGQRRRCRRKPRQRGTLPPSRRVRTTGAVGRRRVGSLPPGLFPVPIPVRSNHQRAPRRRRSALLSPLRSGSAAGRSRNPDDFLTHTRPIKTPPLWLSPAMSGRFNGNVRRRAQCEVALPGRFHGPSARRWTDLPGTPPDNRRKTPATGVRPARLS